MENIPYRGVGLKLSFLQDTEDFCEKDGGKIMPALNPDILTQQIKSHIDAALNADDFIIDEKGIHFLETLGLKFKFETIEDVREFLNIINRSTAVQKDDFLSEQTILSLGYFVKRVQEIMENLPEFKKEFMQ